MKFLYLLSGNLSTTPRAAQSIRAAVGRGAAVRVIAADRGEVWRKLDSDLQEELGIELDYVSLKRSLRSGWLRASLLERFARITGLCFQRSRFLNAAATGKVQIMLHDAAKSRIARERFDLICGHGGGTLYAAAACGKRFGIPWMFDVEDYHPGEKVDHGFVRSEIRRRKRSLRELLPEAAFFTCASPLIAEETCRLLPPGPAGRGMVINNCFEQEEFSESGAAANSPRLQLVWYSQRISYGRGLEKIIPAIERRSDQCELTLIGVPHPDFRKDILEHCGENIHWQSGAMPQKELHRSLSNYDVGLALEVAADRNKELCLSNKIWGYWQAGLFILASDLPGQRGLLEKHPEHGMLTGLDRAALDKALDELILRRDELRNGHAARFRAAADFSWNRERMKLFKAWKEIPGGSTVCR